MFGYRYSTIVYFLYFTEPSNSGQYVEVEDEITKVSVPNIIGTENIDSLDNDWNEEWAIQEFPTNAVGEIYFINEDEGSIKPSKYAIIEELMYYYKYKFICS